MRKLVHLFLVFFVMCILTVLCCSSNIAKWLHLMIIISFCHFCETCQYFGLILQYRSLFLCKYLDVKTWSAYHFWWVLEILNAMATWGMLKENVRSPSFLCNNINLDKLVADLAYFCYKSRKKNACYRWIRKNVQLHDFF